MKRIASILLISISTLGSALCRAESVAITHDFNDMVSKSELTFPNRPSSYAVGETDLVTYTGSAGGAFTLNDKLKFQIGLPKNGGTVQTSPEIANLTGVQITHTRGATPSNIKIYISTDNDSWTEITSSATFNSSTIDVSMPTKGNYYLKVVNESNSVINFPSWEYYYEPCHCLRVVVN